MELISNFTTPTVPHTVAVAWQIYVQYTVPLVFAFFLHLRLKAVARRHERKRLSRKRARQNAAVRVTTFESAPWWVAPELRGDRAR